MWFILPFLTACLVTVCLLMVIVVLMQRPKSEGLGAAFGGGMTDNLFGAETTNVLSRFTVWLGGLFFLLTLVISILYVKRSSGETAVQKQLLKMPPPISKAVGTSSKESIPVPSH
jgi:preprotein translocase subunit SecG